MRTPRPLPDHSRIALTPPAEALLLLVRHDAGSRPGDRLPELLAGEEARSALHSLATRHGVLGTVLGGLHAASLHDPVLASHSRTLLAQRPLIRKQAAMWDLERDRLLRLLDARGLRPMTLKGAALRVSAYADSAQRNFGDVDLLLPESDIDRAASALVAAGYDLGDQAAVARYRRDHFHYRLTNPSGFQVELHWALLPPGSAMGLSPERLLGRSLMLERSGEPAMRIPSAEDMVLHLASQETEDWFSTIRRLVDIDRVVRAEAAFDWGYLRSAATECRMGPVLGFALQLSRRLLATPIPADFIAGLGLSRAARFHLELLDPARAVLTGYSRRRATAPRYLAVWLSPDRSARWRTLRDIATDRFDSFTARAPERAVATPLRGMVILAKLATFWIGLYLRRGVAVVLQSSLGHRGFWNEER
ncbi:MAG TPA: nucleotidyltransferase family protein [Gemmatimonadales bacterium]|nr:nucleotidyltransferase family protein [Gemmatimonadales bacterium]